MKSKITSWGFPFSMIKLQADWVGRKERRQIHNIFNTEEREKGKMKQMSLIIFGTMEHSFLSASIILSCGKIMTL